MGVSEYFGRVSTERPVIFRTATLGRTQIGLRAFCDRAYCRYSIRYGVFTQVSLAEDSLSRSTRLVTPLRSGDYHSRLARGSYIQREYYLRPSGSPDRRPCHVVQQVAIK